MRIVVDTNVFVSAALKDKSIPALAVRLAMQHGTLLKSIATERQLRDVLARPYFTPLVSRAAHDSFILSSAGRLTEGQSVQCIPMSLLTRTEAGSRATIW